MSNEVLATGRLLDSRTCVLGEGPVWDHVGERAVWIDILRPRIMWRNLIDGSTGEVPVPSHIGALLANDDLSWTACLVDGIYRVDAAFTSFTPMASFAHALPPINGMPQIRANDAKVAPNGDVICGTMPYQPDLHPGVGRLYRFVDQELIELLTDVTISNGIGWSPDGMLMYYIDTPTQRIDVFDVDTSGHYTNRRLFAEVSAAMGSPDGLCVDEAGYLWVAMWGGFKVQRFAPDGTPAGFIELPCAQVTSCAFVGRDLTSLIITTAALEDSGNPAAGCTYIVDVDVAGLPTHRAHV